MNATTALARLKFESAWDTDPALSDADLDICLSYAAVVDDNGYEPQDDDYTPTYSAMLLNLSIAAAWDRKASSVEGFNWSADGVTFNPDTQRERFTSKADSYRKKVAGSAALTGRTARFENITGSTVVL